MLEIQSIPALSDAAHEADADLLNKSCDCISLETGALRHALETELGDAGLYDLVAERCPHVFSARPVFVSPDHVEQMARVAAAVEAVVALPAYREAVLAAAAPVARHPHTGTKGVFFGYDFHVGPNGIALIEINTNAGGAMLNAALARVQRACCAEVDDLLIPATGTVPEQRIMDMFRKEWSLARGKRVLRTIAIVDADPQQQYLYPEFLLFRKLFERNGVRAMIADPSQLEFRHGSLWHGDTIVDLVYNRLTDFMLDAPASAALRTAYLADAIVLTPHPQAHALYADKRNLVLLSNAEWLTAIGVPAAIRDVLTASIPRTEIVTTANAECLWNRRRQLFFKPVAGFGGRAAYRGDKLTRRVWQDILAGDYVAQALVAPGERAIGCDSDLPLLKFDVRLYAYDGAVQSMAARLYRGQTTNFRTPGGGFAPVYGSPRLPVRACGNTVIPAAGSRSSGLPAHRPARRS